MRMALLNPLSFKSDLVQFSEVEMFLDDGVNDLLPVL